MVPDVDVLLKEIHDLARVLVKDPEEEGRPFPLSGRGLPEEAEEMASKFIELYGWLLKGGYIQIAWRPGGYGESIPTGPGTTFGPPPEPMEEERDVTYSGITKAINVHSEGEAERSVSNVLEDLHCVLCTQARALERIAAAVEVAAGADC